MKQIAKILYGSQNYHLDGPESDHDYKFLMCPDFNDLYNYHKVNKNDLPEGYAPEHYGVMSVITFDEMLRRGNVNALELLFSREIEFYDSAFERYINKAKLIFKSQYLILVWDEFLSALHGMMFNSFDRYGSNRKTASRALWLLDFAEIIASNNFSLTEKIYADPIVWEKARGLRFSNAPIATIEQFEAMFKDVKINTNRQKNIISNYLSNDFFLNLNKYNDVLKQAMMAYVYKRII